MHAEESTAQRKTRGSARGTLMDRQPLKATGSGGPTRRCNPLRKKLQHGRRGALQRHLLHGLSSQ